jgi:PEP-CTERM motif
VNRSSADYSRGDHNPWDFNAKRLTGTGTIAPHGPEEVGLNRNTIGIYSSAFNNGGSQKMTLRKTVLRQFTLAIVGLTVLAVGPREMSATAIPLGGGGVLNASNMAGGVLAITSNSPCLAFSGASTCGGAITGIDLSGTDPIFGTTGTIKDIGTSVPITAFKTANLTIAGGPATFDLENIITPLGFSSCTFSTILGSCSTGTLVFTQNTLTQVGVSFSTNEIGYLGTSATGSTPYTGIFTTQYSGNLSQFGCVVSGAQTCTDNIANILIFEATAAQTSAAGLGAIGQGGTVKSTWSVTESPNTSTTTPTPEPISLVLFGSGLVGVALFSRRFRRSLS